MLLIKKMQLLRSIEEFLDPHADVVFIDRFYNFEVMTGSYLVKNSAWSRQFLLGMQVQIFNRPNFLLLTINNIFLHITSKHRVQSSIVELS
ncbi:hypothetical protein Y032_0457g1814 [Ancylostoma ceylanicum]|uniref:Uncharacterized protein n=1 Tax=Ancylostoma ceylanicum TaxID=53326 RepID=A0A016X016_9BILA|nr:hypothetical protein Y032_0457g1814 [Ancylostoma ceylanicum]